MMICTVKFDRKKAALAVVLAALVIIGAILLIGAHRKAQALEQISAPTVVRNEKQGAQWLKAQGWEVALPAKSSDRVMIPRTFSQVFEQYNELQKQQGFDLSHCCGQEVEMYTYTVTNAPPDQGEVLAVLYVSGGQVVGGDIHSTALDGFMVGIKQDR